MKCSQAIGVLQHMMLETNSALRAIGQSQDPVAAKLREQARALAFAVIRLKETMARGAGESEGNYG